MKFQDKTCLITGGSSGIGLALAKLLAAQGASVCLLNRDAAKLSAASEQVRAARAGEGQWVQTIQADVADQEQVSPALAQLVANFGTPDLLINAAGIAQPGLFLEQDLSLHRAMMDVNYFGTLHVIKTLLPGMTARRSGHIVNFASLAGMFGVYGYSAYGPTKFAVRGLSDTLRYELAEHNLRVSLVFPPDTQTPQYEYEEAFKPPVLRELDKLNKVLSPEQVADAILRGVSRGRYIITPGFDSTLYFQLTNFFGLVYPVMDLMIANARRTLRAANRNALPKDDHRHQHE